MSGTNIFDLKLKEGEWGDDDLMSSDYDEQNGSQILAAIKDQTGKVQPLINNS